MIEQNLYNVHGKYGLEYNNIFETGVPDMGVTRKTQLFQRPAILFFLLTCLMLIPFEAGGNSLEDVLKAGELRHLGIPYANFVTPDGQGLDVELVRAFADHLGVRYVFVKSTWKNIIPDLTGKKIKVTGDTVKTVGSCRKKGDIISTGFTVLPWREKIVSFSSMTFPSGIWLISAMNSKLTPIKPSGSITDDIEMVKKNLAGVSVLGLQGSCLAPGLYGLQKTGAEIHYFPPDHDLDEMIPSVMAKVVDSTLMDVPVALVALARWPGKIKVIGPLSLPQKMACAFAQDSPELKKAFDSFFSAYKKNGAYRRLVEKYYPSVFTYYPDFLTMDE